MKPRYTLSREQIQLCLLTEPDADLSDQAIGKEEKHKES